MKTDDYTLQVKRSYRKNASVDIAIILKVYIENKLKKDTEKLKEELGHLSEKELNAIIEKESETDKRFIKRMSRQIACSHYLTVYNNDIVRTQFCSQKTCLVCNSNRLAKFLRIYLKRINDANARFHIVLSIKNPSSNNLKEEIERMYKFFQQSSIKRNKRYKELNPKIMMIRSFETTLKTKTKRFNIHFHILIAGEDKLELIEYGELLIEYWIKYFGDKAGRGGQYLEEQQKSALENFKYLVKLKDIEKGHYPMFYDLLKATEGKRLFTAKNFKRSKDSKKVEEVNSNEIECERVTGRLVYNGELKNWIDNDTKKIFVDEEKIKIFKEKAGEDKSLSELQKYFKDVSIEGSKKRAKTKLVKKRKD